MAPLWNPLTVALNTMPGLAQPKEERSVAFPDTRAAFKAGPLIPAKSEPIKMYSNEYYYTCALGGIASCGLTHTAV